MISLDKITFKLSDFKEDPIVMMEVCSFNSEWISTRIFQMDDSTKDWIGNVDNSGGKFNVCRIIKNAFINRPSFIRMKGFKNVSNDELSIQIQPALLFTINFTIVPILLYFFSNYIGQEFFGYLAILVFIVFNGVQFYLEFIRSKTKIIEFCDNLMAKK